MHRRQMFLPDSVAIPLDRRLGMTFDLAAKTDFGTRAKQVFSWMSQFYRCRTVDPW